MQRYFAFTVAAVVSACAGQTVAPQTAPPRGGGVGSVEPPITTVDPPDLGGQPAHRVETVRLVCPVKNPTAACNSEKDIEMQVVVDRMKDCTISSLSHQLTLSLMNSANGNSITLTIPSYGGTGQYQLPADVSLAGLV